MPRVVTFTSTRPIGKTDARWDAHRPKYWSILTLESALQDRNVLYDCVDFAEEKHTETIMVSYTHLDHIKQSYVKLFPNPPLSAHQACQPCSIATIELLRSQLVFPGQDDSYIGSGNSVKIPGQKTTSFLDYVRNERAMDLGTMMANLKTHSWIEAKAQIMPDDPCLRLPLLTRLNSICSSSWDSMKSLKNDGHSGLSIANPYNIPPRRLWDLHSNRVLEVKLFSRTDGSPVTPRMPSSFIAISHSWTTDMQLWMTPINYYQWAVPLPKGTTFEEIRWEALRAGFSYCWLDVLCLRQATMERVDGEEREINEQLRLEEWSIDVPTIGNVYRRATKVLRYFNGLGRELKLTGWDDKRHWMRRAWTLQETRAEHLMVNACVPLDMPFPGRELVEVGGRQLPMRDVLTPLARMVDAAETDLVVQDLSLQQVIWGKVYFMRECSVAAYGERIRFFRMFLQRFSLMVTISAWHHKQRATVLQALWVPLRRVLSGMAICIPVELPMLLHTQVGLREDITGLTMIAMLCLWGWIVIARCGIHGLAGELYNVAWFWFPIGVEGMVLYRYGTLLLRTQAAWKGAGWRLARVWPFSCPIGLLHLFMQAVYHWLRLLPLVWASIRSPTIAPSGREEVEASHHRALLQWAIFCLTIPALAYWLTGISVYKGARPLLQPLFTKPRCSQRLCSILTLVNEMARRDASNDHDKVAGLAYLMRCSSLPLYKKDENIEIVWLRLVAHLPFPAQLELLFNFSSSRNDRALQTCSKVVSGSWIPTWEEISTPRPEIGLELLRPTWPPNWPNSPRAPTPARTYDPASHALLLPSCTRILLVNSITWSTDARSYKLKAVTKNAREGDLGFFYNLCDHDGSVQHIHQDIHSNKSKAYVLILHVYDCESTPISGVVAEVLHPSSAKHWEKWNLVGLGTWYNEGYLKLESELAPELETIGMGVFGLTREEAVETFVVRKVRTLVTDLPGSIGSNTQDLTSHSVIHAPVLFL